MINTHIHTKPLLSISHLSARHDLSMKEETGTNSLIGWLAPNENLIGLLACWSELKSLSDWVAELLINILAWHHCHFLTQWICGKSFHLGLMKTEFSHWFIGLPWYFYEITFLWQTTEINERTLQIQLWVLLTLTNLIWDWIDQSYFFIKYIEKERK